MAERPRNDTPSAAGENARPIATSAPEANGNSLRANAANKRCTRAHQNDANRNSTHRTAQRSESVAVHRVVISRNAVLIAHRPAQLTSGGIVPLAIAKCASKGN